jgi:hypothetical protein
MRPNCKGPVEPGQVNYCKVCVTIAYLEFRFAFNWPLDDNDKRRLGLT